MFSIAMHKKTLKLPLRQSRSHVLCCFDNIQLSSTHISINLVTLSFIAKAQRDEKASY